MFGGCIKALWTAFLGIRPSAPGYSRITIQPCDILELGDLHGSLMTPYGPIYLDLERHNNQISLHIAIPEGVEAVFHFRDIHCLLKPGSYTFFLMA